MKKYLSIPALAFACLLPSLPAHAGLDKIDSPIPEEGELEIQYNGSGQFDGNADKNNKQEHETELEYGLNDRITLRMSGEYEKEPNESFRSSNFSFGGRYQLFEQGKYWIDAALEFDYNHALDSNTADSIQGVVLLEKQFGKIMNDANFSLAQEVGRYSQGGPGRELGWNTRYLLNEHFEPGFEIQSDFGKGSDNLSWANQTHYAGPSLYGEIIPNLGYQLAYYRGLTDASSSNAVRLWIGYDMHF